MLKVKRRGSLFSRKSVKEIKGRGNTVGATYITVAIRNLAEPERVWEGEFLIDTGAVDTLVPRKHLESIGLVPEARRTYGLADGQELIMDIAGAKIESWTKALGGPSYLGRKTWSRCWASRPSNRWASRSTRTTRRSTNCRQPA